MEQTEKKTQNNGDIFFSTEQSQGQDISEFYIHFGFRINPESRQKKERIWQISCVPTGDKQLCQIVRLWWQCTANNALSFISQGNV